MRNEPAFPTFEGDTYDGMTLRDYFAAQAMQGDWAEGEVHYGEYAERAEEYYSMADAMLKAREQK